MNNLDLRFDAADARVRKGAQQSVRQKLPLYPLPELPGYEAILKLWDRKRGARPLPRRTDFAFEDFVGWHGSIAISVVDDDDLLFSLYGSRFVQLLGVDLTNCHLFASLDETLVTETKMHFQDLMAGPYIGHTSGGAPMPDREFVSFDVLDLPLSDDGQTVNRFLHALYSSR